MDALDQAIMAREEAIVGDLKELVRIPSVKGPAMPGAPFGREVARALDWVLSKADSMGFATKNVDGYAGHLEFGEGPEIVGVLTHLDVVPAGDGWNYPPFEATIAGKRIYGRGTNDDKGPAIACLHAMAALRETGFQPQRRIRLILGCDEESGWGCVDYYFAREEKPRFGFSPDAKFPLIMAEKGMLHLNLECAWPPAAGAVKIIGITGGSRRNIVPDACEARLAISPELRPEIRAALAQAAPELTIDESPDGQGLVVKARGVPSHGSRPELGRNAVGALFLGLMVLAPRLPEAQKQVVDLLGGRLGMAYDGAGFGIACRDEISGPLTLNLGTIAWDGVGLKIELDLRYPVTAARDQLIVKVKEQAGPAGLAVTLGHELAPLHVPADHPLVKKLMRVYAEKTGSDAKPISIGGRTYACAIGTGVAFGPIFPGQPDVAHERDEFMDQEELMLGARIYAAAIAALARD